MNEGARIDKWIVATLEADTGAGGLFDVAGALITGVWSERIPPDQVLPAIRFSNMAPMDVVTLNGYRIITTGFYLVTGVIKEDAYDGLVAIADRIDALLHRATGSADGVTIASCIRESEYRMAEDDGDAHYRHLGGMYRVQATT